MRKPIAIHGASDESLALVPILESNPEIEVACIFDPDPERAGARARAMRVGVRILADPAALPARLHAVIDSGILGPPEETFRAAVARGAQVVTPLTARLLWGYGVSSADRKAELLQALHEIVESVNLTVDADELFSRMLEIAMGVTGADRGSLMLVDPERDELRIRVAIGVEPELWPKIRVALGEGIAGRVAADAQPVKLQGRADAERFHLLRERLDVESALCVPLVHGGRVLGVLNLHHTTRPDAFDDDDLEFAEQLGRLDAAIIARAQEHEGLRQRASRYDAVRAVRDALAGTSALETRLESLCDRVADWVGGGIATVYLHDPAESELRLVATSLRGGGLGGEYRIAVGRGVDGRAAQSRDPILLESEGRLAYASLPLLAGDSLVGVLSVQSGPESQARDPRALRETLLEIAAAAADEIAQAEREARMSARATKVSAINESGIRLISTHDAAEVTRLATSSGALILEADHAVLRLQDPDSRRFVIRSYYGSADGRTQETLFRLDKQLCVDTLKARHPRLVRNLSSEPSYASLAGGIRSALSAPLRREGRLVGTLALYDKVAPDQFYAASFDDDDLQIFIKYVGYVERALENAFLYARSLEQRSFDEETGLPNAEYLSRRIDQELARAAGREGALAILVCRLENLEEIRHASAPPRADRLVARTADALRAKLRDFDVLARTAEGEFAALLPDPGPAPEERITSLARTVAEEIAKDDRMNEPVRIALAFGYGVYPAEGRDRSALLARAREPRIRMV